MSLLFIYFYFIKLVRTDSITNIGHELKALEMSNMLEVTFGIKNNLYFLFYLTLFIKTG